MLTREEAQAIIDMRVEKTDDEMRKELTSLRESCLTLMTIMDQYAGPLDYFNKQSGNIAWELQEFMEDIDSYFNGEQDFSNTLTLD